MRILTVITGVFLIATSIWCLVSPGAIFISMAFVLGCVMVFAGVSECFAHFFGPSKTEGFGWMLEESIITFILGCIVLSNQLITDAVVPLFFGMWMVFGGVMRLVLSLSLIKKGGTYWLWVLVLGALSAAAGVYAFFNQILAGLAVMTLIGIFFLLQGINILTSGIFMPSKKKSRVQ